MKRQSQQGNPHLEQGIHGEGEIIVAEQEVIESNPEDMINQMDKVQLQP